MAEFGKQLPVRAPESLYRVSSGMSGDLTIEPENFSFATQDEDERIYILTRRDFITNMGWAVRVGFAVIIPLLIYAVDLYTAMDILAFIAVKFQIAILLSYYTLILTYAVFQFNEWYYNIFLVTNKRIILIRFNTLNRYKIAEADLRNIQDVSESVIGFLPSFFDYGDLNIQTAAEKGRFRVTSVPKVTWLRDVLVDLARLSQ